MYTKFYLPSTEKDKKGLIFAKSKDKKKPYFITCDREKAISYLKTMCRNDFAYLYILKRMEVKGNLNGGYKSEPPFEIVGCEKIYLGEKDEINL